MKKGFVFLIFIFVSVFLAGNVFASVSNGIIDSTNKYAWGSSIGWINFGCTNCNVHITSSGLTGYAWSDNYGWINLNPTNGGVLNNAGALSGNAWGENLGWIDFSGVTINTNGQFTGTAVGDNAGTINFSCTSTGCPVTTDWRATCGNGACTGTENCSTCPADCGSCTSGNVVDLPSSTQTFSFLINNGATKTNNTAVNLTLNGGTNSKQVEISMDANFTGAVKEIYETQKSFVLPAGDGLKIVYVRFFDASGNILKTLSSFITLQTLAPALTVDKTQISLTSDAEVVLSGTASPGAEIFFTFGDKYGITVTDSNGKWQANLGKMSAGTKTVFIITSDSVGNVSNLQVTVVIKQNAVEPSTIPIEDEQAEQDQQDKDNKDEQNAPVIKNLQDLGVQIKNSFTDLGGVIGSFFRTKNNVPPPIVTIPREAPEVLKHKWNLLIVKPPQ